MFKQPGPLLSITVEFHYYLVLPALLWMLRKSKIFLILVILAAVGLRFFIHQKNGQVQSLAYWTIIGRIDQFALGMIVYQFRQLITRRHIFAVATIIGFSAFYWYFDHSGGFYKNPSYPSPNPLWIILPTIEGLAYAIGIAWYETSFSHRTSGVSKFIGRAGEYSYSIYLLHFFVVFRAARFVNEQIMDISNFYLACVWSVIFFLFMMPVGYLSFRLIEAPCLKFRKSYIVPSKTRVTQNQLDQQVV